MEQKVARLIECERIVRQTQAEQLRLIAELNTDEWFATEVQLALQLSPANAKYLVEWASNVAKVFPDVLDALEAGVISERSAHTIVDPAEDYCPHFPLPALGFHPLTLAYLPLASTATSGDLAGG